MYSTSSLLLMLLIILGMLHLWLSHQISLQMKIWSQVVPPLIMIQYKYIVSTIGIIILAGFLITMIYIIRATIPRGTYTWISAFCTFSLFLMVISSLFLGLAYTSPNDFRDEDILSTDPGTIVGITTSNYKELIKIELSSVLSSFISNYAMFPLLVVEVVIYVCLNSRLLWIWFSNGQFDTVVNKFILVQRISGIIYMIGCVVDFGLRLYVPNSFTFMSADTYCSCWMIFYKSAFFVIMTAQFAVAIVRLLCTTFPIEYHNR